MHENNLYFSQKSVTGNCLVQNLMLLKNQHQLQVQNVLSVCLSVMPNNAVTLTVLHAAQVFAKLDIGSRSNSPSSSPHCCCHPQHQHALITHACQMLLHRSMVLLPVQARYHYCTFQKHHITFTTS